jgi:hypothetical protein
MFMLLFVRDFTLFSQLNKRLMSTYNQHFEKQKVMPATIRQKETYIADAHLWRYKYKYFYLHHCE